MAIRRNKVHVLYNMLKKMWLRQRDGQNTYTCIYTCISSVNLNQFGTEEELYKFCLDVIVDMVYIKTPYGEHQIYTDKLDTYRYELSTLTITEFSGKKHVIKLI